MVSLPGLRIWSGLRFEDARDGGVDTVPLVEQASEDLFALWRESVEALIAFVFFAPLAGQKALGFESAEKGIERTFVDLEPTLGEILPERISVVLLPQLRKHGKGETAAAELKSKIFEGVFSYGHCGSSRLLFLGFAVSRTLYFAYCMTTSVRRQVKF